MRARRAYGQPMRVQRVASKRDEQLASTVPERVRKAPEQHSKHATACYWRGGEPKETIYAMRFGGFTGPGLDHEQETLNDYDYLYSWTWQPRPSRAPVC